MIYVLENIYKPNKDSEDSVFYYKSIENKSISNEEYSFESTPAPIKNYSIPVYAGKDRTLDVEPLSKYIAEKKGLRLTSYLIEQVGKDVFALRDYDGLFPDSLPTWIGGKRFFSHEELKPFIIYKMKERRYLYRTTRVLNQKVYCSYNDVKVRYCRSLLKEDQKTDDIEIIKKLVKKGCCKETFLEKFKEGRSVFYYTETTRYNLKKDPSLAMYKLQQKKLLITKRGRICQTQNLWRWYFRIE